MRVLNESDMRWVSGGLCSKGHYNEVEIDDATSNYTMYAGFAAGEKQWLDAHNSSDPDWQFYLDLYNQDVSDRDSWKATANLYIEENNNFYFLNNPFVCDQHSYVSPLT